MRSETSFGHIPYDQIGTDSRYLTITALVIRHKTTNDILHIQTISSECEKINLTYKHPYVTYDDLCQYLASRENVINNTYEEVMLSHVFTNNQFSINIQANKLPSIGLMKVAIERKFVDWDSVIQLDSADDVNNNPDSISGLIIVTPISVTIPGEDNEG